MKRALTTVIFLCLLLAVAPPCALAKDMRPQVHGRALSPASPDATVRSADDPDEVAAEEASNPESQFKPTPECPHGLFACKINRNLDELERKIGETSDQYKKGEILRTKPVEKSEKPPKTKYGTKALKKVALFPVYATRFLTWPIIALSDFLIREHVIRRVVDTVSNDERTLWVYPLIEFGFGTGFGGGVGVRHYNLFNQGINFNASYKIHISMDQEASVSIGTPDMLRLWDKPFAFKFATNVIHHNSDMFYGVGPDTSKSVTGNFNINQAQSGGFFGYQPFKNFLVNGNLYVIWDSTHTASKAPYVQDVFPASELTAFQKGLVYIVPGISISYDDRDGVNPEKGGLYSVSFSSFVGLGSNDYHYNQYDLKAEHFFRILRQRHVLALRTAWTLQQDMGDNIPFYRLATLDVNSPMRGFNYGRFRDSGSAVFNVEYRYPVWDYIDGSLFFDTGRVFHGIKDFSFKHFKYSGGGGFSIRTSDFFLMRLQVAYGGEGVKALFSTSQSF